MASPQNGTNYVLMIAEMRRYPQMSYKSDIVVLSGSDKFDFQTFLRITTRIISNDTKSLSRFR